MTGPPRARVIGIDLDNTLISYDAVFHGLALEAGLIGPGTPADQKAIRDLVRRGPDGDLAWQALQGQAYGPRILEAAPAPGARAFLAQCRQAGLKVIVISHKSTLASVDPTRTPLREAALAWLGAHGFMPLEVRFGATRREKLAHIRAAGCTHFIDDLEETFREPDFPGEVQGILYTPGAGAPSGRPAVAAARSWQEISARIFGADPDPLLGDPALARLLGGPPAGLERLAGGRNSRVYRVTAPDGALFALKAYGRAPGDPRDRLGVETAALGFLRDQGLDCVPRPLAADSLAGLGLFEFIQGRRPLAPTGAEVDEAAAFLVRLHQLRLAPGATLLPAASEARFSLQAVAETVDRRLQALVAGAPALAGFLDGELMPAWRAILARCRRGCLAAGIPFDRDLPAAERTLSPSDFGFHNMLRRDGRLVFLDFEYFGWDDPAKLVADLLLHPGMTLAPALRLRLAEGALAGLGDPAAARARVRLAHPLFGIKWCAILLNEFLPGRLEQRRFAGPEASGAGQLAKARTLLQALREPHDPFEPTP